MANFVFRIFNDTIILILRVNDSKVDNSFNDIREINFIIFDICKVSVGIMANVGIVMNFGPNLYNFGQNYT